MKVQSTCKFPVLITNVDKKPWKVVDKETGAERSGTFNILRGVMIPENPEIDPALLREIEFSIHDNSPETMGVAEVSKVFWKNEDKFKKGEVYAMVETYMSPKIMKDGFISMFSPYVNNVELITPSDEDRPRVIAATKTR